MTVQYSVAVRNAQLDQIEVVVGTTAKFQIYTGTVPANCAATATGTKLLDISLPSDYYANGTGGTKSLLGSWTGSASGTGTAGYYRILDSTGTTTGEQGTVTATGSGGDITLDNTSIASGQTVVINTKVITAGGA